MKYFMVDIGELGWTLYAIAYMRHLKSHGHEVCVMTSSDRITLYDCPTLPLPEDFDKYYAYAQDGFGLYGVGDKELKEFFNQYKPGDYEWVPGFYFQCKRIPRDKLEWQPLKPKRKIVVFPRCRNSEHHKFRNLPKKFYETLCEELCLAFPDKHIMTLGTINGSYILDKDVTASNFSDLVGKTHSVEDLLMVLSVSLCAIGGTSAPPKIAMLQGVPTFVIGHEKERFMNEENYLDTKVGFFELEDYQNFEEEKCIEEIIQWVTELK